MSGSSAKLRTDQQMPERMQILLEGEHLRTSFEPTNPYCNCSASIPGKKDYSIEDHDTNEGLHKFEIEKHSESMRHKEMSCLGMLECTTRLIYQYS